MPHLLAIPRELRNKIYYHLAGEIAVSKEHLRKTSSRYNGVLHLRRTCKQIDEEVKSIVATYTMLKYIDFGELRTILRSPFKSEMIQTAPHLQLDLTLPKLTHILGRGAPTWSYWKTGSDALSPILEDPDLPASDLKQLRKLKCLDVVVPRLDTLFGMGQAEAAIWRMKQTAKSFADTPLAKRMTELQVLRLVDRAAGGAVVVDMLVPVRDGEWLRNAGTMML